MSLCLCLCVSHTIRSHSNRPIEPQPYPLKHAVANLIRGNRGKKIIGGFFFFFFFSFLDITSQYIIIYYTINIL